MRKGVLSATWIILLDDQHPGWRHFASEPECHLHRSARTRYVNSGIRPTGTKGTCYNPCTAEPRTSFLRHRCWLGSRWLSVWPTHRRGLDLDWTTAWKLLLSVQSDVFITWHARHRSMLDRSWATLVDVRSGGSPWLACIGRSSIDHSCSFARLSSRALCVQQGTQKRPSSLQPEASRVIPPYSTASWQRRPVSTIR
jgi:hypothetical protein